MSGKEKHIWFGRRKYPVLREMRIGDRRYLVVRDLSGTRKRYQAYDSEAGPDGDMRAIHVYPRAKEVTEGLKVLKRASESNWNTPTILEYRPAGNQVYVVLTWIWGQVLADFLDGVRRGRQARPSAREVVRMVRGVAHGLNNLSKKKTIVHGDVKPDNLIMSREPSRLSLIDFGSAWLTARAVRWQEQEGASGPYASPEQLAFGSEQALGTPDFRSDQFSLSVVCYELLTLQVPYDALGGIAGADGHYRQRYAGKLVPPSRLRMKHEGLSKSIWRKIDDVVATGLALTPTERYRNGSDWLDAWDEIYVELKKRRRVGPVNSWVSTWIAQVWGQGTG